MKDCDSEKRPDKDEINASGTLIRGADGSLYFLRDDLLEACRVTEEDSLPFLNELVDKFGGGNSGFVLESGPVKDVASLQGPFGRPKISGYTTMCTGTMGLIDFVPRSQNITKK